MSTVVLEPLAIVAAGLVTLTALLLLAISDWRLSILLIAIQYTGVFLLVALDWPIPMAIAKLVVGWIAGAVLGMAFTNSPELRQTYQARIATGRAPTRPGAKLSSAFSFYIFTALAVIVLISMAFLSRTTAFSGWLPGIHPAQAWGALVLVGIGLVKLGFTTQPLHTILGLLTALSGFEIIYAQAETSALVAELLAGITLGLAMAGVYLLLAPAMREDE